MPARAKLTTNEITQSTISVDNFIIGDEMSHAEMDSNFLNLRDQTFGIVGDDSTGIDVKAGDTIKFLGQGGATVNVIGNQVVIDTPLGGGGGGVTSMRFVGDDSTGVVISDGETLKITGSQNVSVIATQDTVTITGPDLTSYATASSSTAFTNKTGNISQWTNNSGYLTNSQITIVGDDSTGTTLNTGETIKVVGAGTVTTAVVNDVLTITGTGGGGSIGDLTVTGSTISSPSNANITLGTSGTGQLNLDLSAITLGYNDGSTKNRWNYDSYAGVPRIITGGDDDLMLFVGSTGRLIVESNILALKAQNAEASDSVYIGGGRMGMTTYLINSTANRVIDGFDPFTVGWHSAYVKVESYVTTADAGVYALALGTGDIELQSGNTGSIILKAGSGGSKTIEMNQAGQIICPAISILDNKITANRSDDDLKLSSSGTGTIDLLVPTSATIGANGAASAPTANPVGYMKVKVNGTQYQIPYYNV
jgi:hypothetical protein